MEAVRTPIGRYRGALKTVRSDDLAALVIRTVVERSKVDPGKIEDVFFGAANQAGEDNRNVARMAAPWADPPETVPINAVAASTHLRNVLEERVFHGFSGFSVIHLDEPNLPETAMLVWMLTVPAIMLIPKRRN